MKIQEIKISIREKYFLKYDGLANKNYKESLLREKADFLQQNRNIEIVEDREILNVDSDGKSNSIFSKNYSGYFLKYYEGNLIIEGEQNKSKISMKVSLNNSIIDLVLKEAGGEIKELVKKEYEEFESQLYQLIDKTEKKNVFGNFVVSKFKKLKELILDNANK